MEGYDVHVASLADNRYIAYHHHVEIPNGFLGDITQLTCELDYCLEKPVTIHIDLNDFFFVDDLAAKPLQTLNYELIITI